MSPAAAVCFAYARAWNDVAAKHHQQAAIVRYKAAMVRPGVFSCTMKVSSSATDGEGCYRVTITPSPKSWRVAGGRKVSCYAEGVA